MMPKARKLYIKTYGCQMNVYDSHRMAEALKPLNYSLQSRPAGADLVILNTCHIREKASEKVYSEIGRLRTLKEDNPEMLLAVAGCVAQAEGQEVCRRAEAVDLVFGPQSYHRLPQLLEKVQAARKEGKRGAVLDLDFPEESKFDLLPQECQAPAVSSFLSVQEGCDKFCSFCVVPYTRGAEYSRPVLAIRDEALKLVETGAREITLLGQNVNAFHGEGPDGKDWGLGRLIRFLAEIKGLERLRFTTSHPRDMQPDLLQAFGDEPKLMPYLHLPVQAGSNAVLRAMNRKHSREDYLHLVDKLRDHRPDIALSGDFIVGFPGESDADFAQTLDLVTRVGYAQAYSFRFSPRPGTPAAVLENQVPEAAKSERLASLQQLLEAQQEAFNLDCVGQETRVLVERRGRKRGQLVGRSPYMQAVHFEAHENLMGEFVDVKILSAGRHSLSAALRQQKAA